ncbi:MAG: hypothetical protein J6I58_01700 [Eubacterium sp.]|nr:hypothetical protein [Eubacterium sp.]MBR1772867.1 hypothetical protein [Eubacterium sp.]
MINMKTEASIEELRRISKMLEEKDTSNAALWLNQESFGIAYRFMLRYVRSYRSVAYRALVTLNQKSDSYGVEEFVGISDEFGKIINHSLRKSDVMMQSKPNQYFLLLPELSEENIESVFARIRNEWKKTDYYDKTTIRFDAELVKSDEEVVEDKRDYGRVNLVPYDYFDKKIDE